MDYKKFFDQHGKCLIYGHEDMMNFTTEELYQAIKYRLLDELLVDVPNTANYGRLVDND